MGMPAVNPPEYDFPDPETFDTDDYITMEEDQIIKLRPCFGSDERYFCKRQCEWAHQCKKLRAEWLR